MQVSFVGAGPGDSELITVKGRRLLGEADVIIYAGSLVNPALLSIAKEKAEIYNSAGMTFDEVVGVMEQAAAAHKYVVRLHTGDPSLYGAIKEQMDALKKRKIAYEVVPGVSSFLAAAAALECEYTLPDVSQTVIITRLEGRTSVPPSESLTSLAAHKTTMCIFLSVHMLERVVEQLLAGGYPLDTPIAIVQKASWPEQQILSGTLEDIAAKASEAEIDRTAMIVVGKCLDSAYALSRLYAPEFGHMYRDAT